MKKERIKESDLAKHFISYFENQGWEVFSEVPHYGIIDFVARKKKKIPNHSKSEYITCAVEVKTQFNFAVIEQADRNKRCATYSFVAVPKPKRRTYAYEICRKLGIGVLEFDDRWRQNFVSEAVKPVENWNITEVNLEEFMKESVAGSQNERMTYFKNSVKLISDFLHENGPTHINEVVSAVDHHWTSHNSAKQCIRNWCKTGVIKEFYVEKAIVKLTQ